MENKEKLKSSDELYEMAKEIYMQIKDLKNFEIEAVLEISKSLLSAYKGRVKETLPFHY